MCVKHTQGVFYWAYEKKLSLIAHDEQLGVILE